MRKAEDRVLWRSLGEAYVQKGETNAAFEDDPENYETKRPSQLHGEVTTLPTTKDVEDNQERAVWGNQIEFLLSCIATSVGLGNVWRFPFVAYQNGGGAFLIPYVIVLLVIGKPMYYLECALGQFSSRNSVRIWALAPAMKGTGYAQAIGSSYMLSYYVAIIALCLFYLVQSFSPQLPWAVCAPQWDACVPSGGGATPGPGAVSSAELYFTKTVVQLSDGIEGGLGAPIWYLALCLLASWVVIFLIVVRGVRSSGKASYFLAIFPYFIMIILLIRSVTLEGASTGILFFLTPQWDKLLEINVWYAAVTQVFFSLGVGTGAIIMFSSYNGFRQNIYRDAMIVTTLDTFTSLMSGITIFGILGNLAFELGYEDVDSVIGSGGTSLAFVSYPDAIAKSPFLPQLFSILFFLMMCVLGVGSAVAVLSTITTLVTDACPRAPPAVVAAGCCAAGFLVGLVYVTPGGQYILELVDYYGATFLILFGAIVEIIGVFWIYGLENVCLDIELMLGVRTSAYWRVCWGLATPGLMVAVFVYSLISFKPLVFGGDYVYPFAGYVAGFTLLLAGVVVVPIFLITTLYKYRTGRFSETVAKAFSMKSSWGPRRTDDRRDWLAFREQTLAERQKLGIGRFRHIYLSLTGGYRRQTDI
ncbi:unnamed protein product [Plutella xylostella]|uniref:Transporter n=1 Tax=Plutella xylostella TaxID=51655 RepID=A0A8S4ECB6_PLUXY|nr:unnamed protein product [Plutella xylostella]